MAEEEEMAVSVVARHETISTLHWLLLSFHGLMAVVCWMAFVVMWVSSKGTVLHKRLGKLLFFAFLVPMEFTGFLMIPGLFVSRKNIMQSAGPWVISSMGFLFAITTYDTFYSRLCQSKEKKSVRKLMGAARGFTLIAQWAASLFLASHAITQPGTAHGELCLELFVLTFPCTVIGSILRNPKYRGRVTHGFYGTYLTFQMFPGSLIVFTRDKYWIFGPNGIQSCATRVVIDILLLLPFAWKTISYLAQIHQRDRRMNTGLIRDVCSEETRTMIGVFNLACLGQDSDNIKTSSQRYRRWFFYLVCGSLFSSNMLVHQKHIDQIIPSENYFSPPQSPHGAAGSAAAAASVGYHTPHQDPMIEKYAQMIWQEDQTERTWTHECKNHRINNETWAQQIAPWADKIGVKNLIESRLGSQEGFRIPKTLATATFENQTALIGRKLLEALPDKYIVKPNHGYGHVAKVEDGKYSCIKKCAKDVKGLSLAKETTLKAMYINGYRSFKHNEKIAVQLQYSYIPKRIMIEEYLPLDRMEEWKFFVINGVPVWAGTRCGNRDIGYMQYDTSFQELHMRGPERSRESLALYCPPDVPRRTIKPTFWDRMLTLASDLA